MKTLYESILDNEDVLVDKIKKTVKNPFVKLKFIYDNTPRFSEWMEAVDKELKKIKLPKGVFYNTLTNAIRFISKNGNGLFDIYFDDDFIKSTKKDAYCILVDYSKDYSKSLNDEEVRIIRDFCKQYDFKSTNPNNIRNTWLYLEK